MKVKVLLFATLREAVGAPHSTLELERDSNVGDVWAGMAQLYPRLCPHAGTTAFAINGTYARSDEPVKDGDEIAFLPPVSGG